MAASFLNRAVQINIGNSDELVLNSDVTQVLTLDLRKTTNSFHHSGVVQGYLAEKMKPPP